MAGIEGDMPMHLIKLNQIGTLTETLDTIRLATGAKLPLVISIARARPKTPSSPNLARGQPRGQIQTGSFVVRIVLQNTINWLPSASSWAAAGPRGEISLQARALSLLDRAALGCTMRGGGAFDSESRIAPLLPAV